MRQLAALALLAIGTANAAPKLACTMDDATRRYFCIDENAVRAGMNMHGDLRASRLYTGSEKSVNDAGMYLIADCKSGIVVMQDDSGINAGGNTSYATPVARDLTKWLCEHKKPKLDPKLRQFGR